VTGAALAVLAAGSAGAQMFPPIGFQPLTKDDQARMHAAAARLYEGRSIGAVERWRSPTSKDAGEVAVTRTFTYDGKPCRTLVYRVRFNADRSRIVQYQYNWCMVSKGEWKIVEVNDPAGR
jgi:surface antigen